MCQKHFQLGLFITTRLSMTNSWNGDGSTFKLKFSQNLADA